MLALPFKSSSHSRRTDLLVFCDRAALIESTVNYQKHKPCNHVHFLLPHALHIVSATDVAHHEAHNTFGTYICGVLS